MTNQQIIQRPSTGLGFNGFGTGLFPETILDRLFTMPFTQQPNLMRQYRKEDGATVLEYNLAGYKDDEITINIDTALHELIIKADHTEEGNRRKFATSLTLSPYTSPEDVNVKLENGVLTIEIAPLEKRKQEALIQLPLNNNKKTIEDNPE